MLEYWIICIAAIVLNVCRQERNCHDLNTITIMHLRVSRWHRQLLYQTYIVLLYCMICQTDSGWLFIAHSYDDHWISGCPEVWCGALGHVTREAPPTTLVYRLANS